jgi:hypothetical protein
MVFDTTGSGLAPAKSAEAQTEPQDRRARAADAFTAPNPFRRLPGKS